MDPGSCIGDFVQSMSLVENLFILGKKLDPNVCESPLALRLYFLILNHIMDFRRGALRCLGAGNIV